MLFRTLTDAPQGRLPRTVEAIAANELRSAIVRGALSPGTKIRQQATAEELGVSLIPLREALKALTGEGIVTHHPQRGYFVAELGGAAIGHVYDARQLLESAVEADAIPRLLEHDCETMASALRAQVRAVEEQDAVEMIAANRRFHFTVFERCENEWLLRFVTQLWDALDPYRVLSYRRMWLDDVDRGVPAEILDEHRRILGALEKRDVESALKALRVHRQRSETFIDALVTGVQEGAAGPEDHGVR